MRLPVLLVALLAAFPAPAQEDATLVATRSLRARTVVSPDDVALAPGATPGALTHPEDAIGMETRVAVYAGRPVMPGDLGPPALVEAAGVAGSTRGIDESSSSRSPCRKHPCRG